MDCLTPIANLLHANLTDDKYNNLNQIINVHCISTDDKVLVFVHRYPTALYLLHKIEMAFKHLAVQCMIEASEGGILKLKGSHTRQNILKDFSPSAHEFHMPEKVIDILICTDADSMGIDLPDVNVIVNYDCPEGADTLFQRAGRIMRMTDDPCRTVFFYTFIPSIYQYSESLSLCERDIKQRFNRITRRHKKSRDILSTDVFTHESEIDVSLEGTIDMEKFDTSDAVLQKLGGFGSMFLLEHSLTLNNHREKSKALSGFLHSAVEYSGTHKLFFLLIRHIGKMYKIIFNLDKKEFETTTDLSVLNLISCSETAERAFISPKEIEQVTTFVADRWCKTNEIEDKEKVEKICVLMLVPSSYNEDKLLKDFVKKLVINI